MYISSFQFFYKNRILFQKVIQRTLWNTSFWVLKIFRFTRSLLHLREIHTSSILRQLLLLDIVAYWWKSYCLFVSPLANPWSHDTHHMTRDLFTLRRKVVFKGCVFVISFQVSPFKCVLYSSGLLSVLVLWPSLDILWITRQFSVSSPGVHWGHDRLDTVAETSLLTWLTSQQNTQLCLLHDLTTIMV